MKSSSIRKLSLVIAVAAPLILTGAEASEEARAIVEKMIEKEGERSAGVEAYVVQESNSVGHTHIAMYEKIVTPTGHPDAAAADNFIAYRLVLPDEIQFRLSQDFGNSPTQLYEAALGVAAVGFGTFGLLSRDQWLGLVEDSEGGVVRASEVTASAAGTPIRDMHNALQALEDLRKFGDMADLNRLDDAIEGDFFVLTAEDVNQKQQTEEGEYTIDTISLYVNQETYTPHKLIMSGKSKLEKTGVNPLEITKWTTDYRNITGSSLLLPFHSRMEIRLSAGDEQELQDMQKELDEFKKKLEDLPPEQKKIMEEMMSGQLEKQMEEAENMAQGHAVGSEVTVDKVCVGGIETWVTMMSELHDVDPGPIVPAGPLQCTEN